MVLHLPPRAPPPRVAVVRLYRRTACHLVGSEDQEGACRAIPAPVIQRRVTDLELARVGELCIGAGGVAFDADRDAGRAAAAAPVVCRRRTCAGRAAVEIEPDISAL